MLKKLIKALLPKKYVDELLTIRNNYLDGHSLKSYSQEGEDMILRRLFENQKSGFYVDVGAHHPKRFSNTYFFYKKNWFGINIDAMPGSMKSFCKFRPRDINIEKPISDKEELLTYYIFNEPALNGFSKTLSESRDGNGNYFIKDHVDLKTSTLTSILDEKLPDNQEIDFLTVDVEGLDFLVIKSNDFKKYRPKVILIEMLSNKFSEIENDEISKYLLQQGYSIYSKTVNTVFFIEKNFYQSRL